MATPVTPPGDSRDHAAPLVGRQAELTALAAAVAAPPALALVEGEAGVGKTRLLAELAGLDALRARQLLVGRCRPHTQRFPLGPVVEAVSEIEWLPGPDRLSPLVGALHGVLPELADRFPPALEPLGHSAADRHRAFRALAALLDAAGPALLVVEDLHWVDDDTCALLEFFAADMPDGLAVVATARPEELDRSRVPAPLVSRPPAGVTHLRLPLGLLTVEQTGRLAAELLDVGELPEGVASSLHRRTSGLPFAVEEIVALLRDDATASGSDWSAETVNRLPVPVAVGDTVIRRTARLSEAGQAVAATAAVLGMPADTEELAAVAGLSDEQARTGVTECLSAGLLERTEAGYGFRHVLAQEAVYEHQPDPKRQWLDRRAIAVLSRRDPTPHARLAHHCRRGGHPTAAAEHVEAAGDRAARAGNHAAAADFFHEALADVGTGDNDRVRSGLGAKYARAALYGLDHNRAIPLLRRLLEAGDIHRSQRGEVGLYLGWLLLQAGDTAAGVQQLRAVVPEMEDKPGLAARAQAFLARPWLDGRETVARRLERLERAAQLAAEQDDPTVSTAVAAGHANVLMMIGDPDVWDAVEALPVTAPTPAQQRALMLGHLNLAQNALHTGHDSRAQALLDAGRDHAGALHDEWLAGSFHITQALLDWTAGRWDGLLPRVEDLAHACRETPLEVVDAVLLHGLLLLAHGQPDRAAETLRSAFETAERIRAVPLLAAAAAGLARLDLATGDPDDACTTTTAAIRVVESTGVWVWAAPVAPTAVAARLTAGHLDAARRLTDELTAGLTDRDAPAGDAATSWCQALIAADQNHHTGETQDRFEEAAHRYKRLGRPYELAQVREAHGAWLAARGGPAAESTLQAALRAYGDLDAQWDVARTCQTLRSNDLAVPHPWRGGRRAYGQQLSPRERQVAALAATGRTNQQIAERLFISHRTVEYHVSNALSKLGIDSRHDFPPPEDLDPETGP